MTVNTKGFLLSPCKDVMLLSGIVKRALDHLILQEKKLTYPDRADYLSARARDRFRTTTLRLEPDTGMVCIDFTYRGERRMMSVFFTCDCDRIEYGPQSITVSMGCSGNSELFVMTALHGLSMLGPVYYDSCDSDDTDFALLDETPPTYLGAVNLGYLTGRLDLQTWLDAWDNGNCRKGCTFEQFFGMAEEPLRALAAASDYKASWDAIEELAKARVETPRFLEEYHQSLAGAM